MVDCVDSKSALTHDKVSSIITFSSRFKPGFHMYVLAERTTALDASRCMDTNDHNQSQPSQQNCDCDLSKPTTQKAKKKFFLNKKSKAKYK